jgi:hypothetical protein
MHDDADDGVHRRGFYGREGVAAIRKLSKTTHVVLNDQD